MKERNKKELRSWYLDESRIRKEEIYRLELRRSLERKQRSKEDKILKSLNQPIVLWFLSTVIVGLFAFFYSNYQESKKLHGLKLVESKELTKEIQFRTNQIEEVINAAMVLGADLKSRITSNEDNILGEEINRYLERTYIVSVTANLGGLFTPPSYSGSYDLPHGGYGLRHLPSKKGYRYQDYSGLNLFELVERQNELSRNHMSDQELMVLQRFLLDLKKVSDYGPKNTARDWSKRKNAQGEYKDKYGEKDAILKLNVNNFDDDILRVHHWLTTLSEQWLNIINSKAVSFARNPIYKKPTIFQLVF